MNLAGMETHWDISRPQRGLVTTGHVLWTNPGGWCYSQSSPPSFKLPYILLWTPFSGYFRNPKICLHWINHAGFLYQHASKCPPCSDKIRTVFDKQLAQPLHRYCTPAPHEVTWGVGTWVLTDTEPALLGHLAAHTISRFRVILPGAELPSSKSCSSFKD